MSGIENEKYFLLFLLHNSNKRQSTSILKTITNSQYSLLKSFANDILDEMIPLNAMQFKKLVQYKDFIRKLSGTKVSPATLSRNIECIKAIISVVLNEHEVRNKTSTYTHRRVGKSKKAFTNKEYFKYCGSQSSSSDEEGGNSSRQWDQTNGSEKEEEETLFESYGSEEEECNFNN